MGIKGTHREMQQDLSAYWRELQPLKEGKEKIKGVIKKMDNGTGNTWMILIVAWGVLGGVWLAHEMDQLMAFQCFCAKERMEPGCQ